MVQRGDVLYLCLPRIRQKYWIVRRSRAAPTGKPNLVPGLVVSGPGTRPRIDPTVLLPAGFRLRETWVEGRPLTRVPVLDPSPVP